MEIIDKIVDFTYCKTCEFRDNENYLDPCHDCLNEPTNVNSVRPINYMEDSKKVQEEVKNSEIEGITE